MKGRNPLGDDDFILTAILWVVVILGFLFIAISWSNNIVNAAYSLSNFVTKDQVTKAEELGAIQRTSLEVVNNYGSQLETFNPQEQ